MTKQEIIKEAYGKLFETHSHLIDSNGWLNNSNENDYLTMGETEFLGETEFKNDTWFRPKSLQGFENNNGWLHIESENDLPKEDCSCFVVFDNGEVDCQKYFSNYKDFANTPYKYITHYQIAKIPKLPIY